MRTSFSIAAFGFEIHPQGDGSASILEGLWPAFSRPAGDNPTLLTLKLTPPLPA